MSEYLEHMTLVEDMKDKINDFALDMYNKGRAEERVKVLERVKQRLITYSVGDEVIIDFNSLFDELSEIEAEE